MIHELTGGRVLGTSGGAWLTTRVTSARLVAYNSGVLPDFAQGYGIFMIKKDFIPGNGTKSFAIMGMGVARGG
jgi:hypothetical protein